MAEFYIISPEDFDLKTFQQQLDKLLKSDKIAAFQLRLKNKSIAETAKIAKKILPICHANAVPFIINDYVEIARDLAVDGIHLGGKDSEITKVRKEFGDDLIIGASCYNSRHKAMIAGEQGASYLAFGSFFQSSTKPNAEIADIENLKWACDFLNLPICAIGGIKQDNVKLFKNIPLDFICLISAVWQTKKDPADAFAEMYAAYMS